MTTNSRSNTANLILCSCICSSYRNHGKLWSTNSYFSEGAGEENESLPKAMERNSCLFVPAFVSGYSVGQCCFMQFLGMLTINILSRQPCLCRCQFSLDINFVLFVFLLDKILMFKLTSFFGEYLAHMQQAQDSQCTFQRLKCGHPIKFYCSTKMFRLARFQCLAFKQTAKIKYLLNFTVLRGRIENIHVVVLKINSIMLDCSCWW